jgi:hypothetical protein
MKCNYLVTTFYVILFILFVRFLYYLFIHYYNNKLIQQIIKTWKEKTNGNVEKVYLGVYTNDYLLSFSTNHDRKNHIHLVTNNFYSNYNEFISFFFKPRFEIIPATTIGYIIKKNNKYLPPIKINKNADPQHICYHMIKSYQVLDLY